jgi:phage shock protein PspC (stress-responsive transcriptional regulator)
MKKVININFQGRVIPIEESAYDILKQYIESLTRYFANEDGKEEIINDIEGRIAELFGEVLKKGSTCITDEDVNTIIASMGRPEDFDGEEANIHAQINGDDKKQGQSGSQQHNSQYSNDPKRLFRDENNKVLGGVCSGLANYFGIDPVIMRILFLITIFGAGFGFITYLILWIVVPSSASTVIGSPRKRLFRDGEDKVIAGVCSGLARYFGISVIIPRLLFIIPFLSFVFRLPGWGWWGFPHFLSFSFSPGALFIYIILWLVIPEAKTTSDKLEMKGEKVDLNNIKSTIQNDLEGLGKKAKQWGTEFGETVSEKGKQFSSEAAGVAKKNSRGVGDFIVLLFKIFAYFIIGVVLFAVVVSLFSIGVVFTGLTPVKPFVIDDGLQNVYAMGTLLLFIWVPIIGLITLIIRRLAKIKGNSKLLRYAFVSLWLIGLFCFISLIISVKDDYYYSNHPAEENVEIVNPKVSKLEITAPHTLRYYNRRWFKMEPFASYDEDSVFVQNVRIRIVKSKSDSFTITQVKLANGSSKKEADNIASKIKYDIVQEDTILKLDKGITITRDQKFRNQHIILTIAVPVGKKIKVNDNIGWNDDVHLHMGFDNDNWNDEDYNDQKEERWSHGVEYIMTTKGLERTDKKKEDEEVTPDNEGVTPDNNEDQPNNAVEEFKKSKEEILKQKEQKLKELRDIDKELQNNGDSTRYHYQPDNPKKPEAKKIVEYVPAKANNTSRIMHFDELLLMKFSI